MSPGSDHEQTLVAQSERWGFGFPSAEPEQQEKEEEEKEVCRGELWAALFAAIAWSGAPVMMGLHKPSCWRLGLHPSPPWGRWVGEIKEPRGKGLVGSSL